MTDHPIPLEALDADIAIVAKKGRGKTYTAKGIVEILLKLQRRVLVFDPLSIWWGLKTSTDGERPAFPIAVFGGPHGDMPLREEMGRPLARVIAGENLPVVVDMGDMRKAAWQRLVADLLDELFATNRDPLWIVLEEADVFAPQQPREGDSARVLGEIDRIARRGRAYGFRLISITQRPARIHKDVLTQLSTLIALGLTSPQDRDAIKAWVEGNADRDSAKTVIESLAQLQVGEGWVWAPDHDLLERVRFPAITTLDTSKTPKAGERRIEAKTLAEVDLSAVREALASGPPEAAVSKKATAAVNLAAVKEAEQRGYERGLVEGEKRGRKVGISVALAAAGSAIANLRVDGIDAAVPVEPAVAPAMRAAPAARPAAKTNGSAPRPDLGAERRPLAVLVAAHPAGYTEAQWATLAGFKRTGGTWGTYKSRLRVAGLIEQRGSTWHATQPGVEALGGTIDELPQDPDGRITMWKAKVPGVGPMLDALRSFYPDPVDRNDLAERLSLTATGGTFGTYLSRLRTNGLIEEPQRGLFRLSSAIMENRPGV